jgi:hypothetical protein
MLLKNELEEINRLIEDDDKTSTIVSQKGVYWHTDHLLKVIIGICNTLKKSDPDKYTWSFNFWRLFTLTTEFFPRGRGKAPKHTTTVGVVSRNELLAQIKIAENQLESIGSLPAKSHFLHPYFGNLNLWWSKKFLKTHTRHHLKIIREITASS